MTEAKVADELPHVNHYLLVDLHSLSVHRHGEKNYLFFLSYLAGILLINAAQNNNNEFLQKLKQYLQQTDIDQAKICFDITETAAIADIIHAKNFFIKLKEFGCKFSLDDFGSVLSSFGYLKSLPVDYLRIDGMFVRDILNDPVDHAMVESIHNVECLMGLQTIAEFVENREILDRTAGIGIDYAQGYFIGKPEMIAMAR